ncbi:hypothetical protein BP5796_06392 [Coleophoma crateriformis]|uniref:Enoyl reductase (ER) domain-containing protein n=1 Tax=Coleophoma crateriformis TaxID=565419 RepID=A0A3D8RP37_9HELO|nr:hypothetical protein BP5796_06392 [Coleophoma crateriformis]
MDSKYPVIQVLSRQNYEHQHIVALPGAIPLPPLAPSSLRVQSYILSLTTNNFTYARVGSFIGSWWEVHPLPPSIPAEFADSNKYGRISAWGYGVVTESTLSEDSTVKVGSLVYGYLPIGTLPVDLEGGLSTELPGQFLETSSRRKILMPIYNRYLTFPPSIPTEQEKQSLGHDALWQVLFETGYLFNRFIFAFTPTDRVHPDQELGPVPEKELTVEQTHIGPDTTVVIFAGSGKTALGFAHELRHGRPEGCRPGKIVAVGSQASSRFVEGTGLYDVTMKYDADEGEDFTAQLGVDPDAHLILCDFGARGGAQDRWAGKLKALCKSMSIFRIGGEVVATNPEETLQAFMKSSQSEGIQINASDMRVHALRVLGEKRYFEEFLDAWQKCKSVGVKGLNLRWGKGMEDLAGGWDKLASGEIGPDQGLVFDLGIPRLSPL